jgi:hypothetical protein
MRAVAIVVMAALAGTAHADPAADEQAVRAAAKAFVAALAGSDDRAIEKAFAAKVQLSYVHYASIGCDKTWHGKKSIKRRGIARLTACLYEPGKTPDPDHYFAVARENTTFVVDPDGNHTYTFRKRGKTYVIERISGFGLPPDELFGDPEHGIDVGP